MQMQREFMCLAFCSTRVRWPPRGALGSCSLHAADFLGLWAGPERGWLECMVGGARVGCDGFMGDFVTEPGNTLWEVAFYEG